MMGYIVAVILAIIMGAVLKNTTYFQYTREDWRADWKRTEEKPITLKLWQVIVIILSCFTSWFSIVIFIAFWICWLFKTLCDTAIITESDTYWRLHGKSVMKIINFLNKPV